MISKVKGKCRSVTDETQQHHQHKLSLLWEKKGISAQHCLYQQEQQGIERGGGECINTGSRRSNICNVNINSTEYNLRKTMRDIIGNAKQW